MKSYRIIALLLFSLAFGKTKAQDDPSSQLAKKLDQYTTKISREKVHLHLDKPYYAIGDDIWFKAYVVDGKTLMPTSLSNILYVELIDVDHTIKMKLRLPLQNGVGWGDFSLSDSLPEGNYRIRAYTQWMRNTPQSFFDKTIQIGNNWDNEVSTKTNFYVLKSPEGESTRATIALSDSLGNSIAKRDVLYEVKIDGRAPIKGKIKTNENGQLNIDVPNLKPKDRGKIRLLVSMNNGRKVIRYLPMKIASNAIDLQFFPEGGHLVEGITSKIAFKAINLQGLGQTIKGTIVDNEGIEVCNFESIYLGMGSFYLTPNATKTYTAKFKLTDGTDQSVLLPKAQKNGYVMMVDDIDTATIGVKVYISQGLLNQGDLNFISHRNGKPYTVASIPTTAPASLVTLAKRELPSGIIQLSLLSPSNVPVCERLIFINNATDTLRFQVQNLQPTYTKRQAIDLTLIANAEKPAWADFSVSVTNTAAVTPDVENESNMLTSLLLTSDLAGYVEKPNHYFLKRDQQTKKELDHLLLTQGWRKIDWEQVNGSASPTFNFEAEKSMKIEGTAFTGENPLKKMKITLLSKNNGLVALDTLTNNQGKFTFDNLQITDDNKVILQAKVKKEKNVLIKLDTIPAQAVTDTENWGDVVVNVNEQLQPYLKENVRHLNDLTKRGLLSHAIQLKEVRIVSAKVNPAKNSTNLNGPGGADQVLDGSHLTGANSLAAFLQGNVPSITVRNGYALSKRKFGSLATKRTLKGEENKLDTMAVAIDGVMMPDGFNLHEVNTNDIESIEILVSLHRLAIYGPAGYKGLILITTSRGKAIAKQPTPVPGLITPTIFGYHVPKVFYVPKYDVDRSPNPDLRNTVYWNPNISVDEKGVAKFSYFNSDQVGKHRMVIEGIDAYGNLGRQTLVYEVK